MKRTLKRLLAVCAILSVIGTAVGTYAYFSDITSVTNHISLGDVNIALKEYEIKNGKEIAYENPKLVLPGDLISKIPRITNYGEPCWVRAKITYRNSMGEMEGFSDQNLSGITGDWIKRGEYYYYKRILGRMESVSLFTGLEVPRQWTEAHSSQKLAVEIRTDAIQSANFTPDFQAMSPWKDQEIQLCVHELNGKETARESNVKLSVEFQGASHKLVAVPDDFFSNFQLAMPGDILEDSAEISNTTSRDAEIFFHTGIVCQREDRMDLLKKLRLTIKMGDELIYQGDLMSSELSEEISLGVFSPGEKGNLNFTVEVPPELDNKYALRDTMIKWYFTVYENDDQPGVIPTVPDDSEPAQEHITERKGSPKTGDDSLTGQMWLLLAGSLAGCIAVLILWKGGKKA